MGAAGWIILLLLALALYLLVTGKFDAVVKAVKG
jgi:hypothetical protein